MAGIDMKRLSVISAVAVLAINVQSVALAAPPSPAPVKTVAGLLAADETRYKAMAAHDVDTVNKLLGDELVYVHSRGEVQDKAGHFGDFAAGKARYNHIDIKEAQGRVYGDVGVIHGVADFYEGNRPKPGTLRYTDIYVWRDQRWQMITFHCTRLGEAPPPRGAPAETPPPPEQH